MLRVPTFQSQEVDFVRQFSPLSPLLYQTIEPHDFERLRIGAHAVACGILMELIRVHPAVRKKLAHVDPGHTEQARCRAHLAVLLATFGKGRTRKAGDIPVSCRIDDCLGKHRLSARLALENDTSYAALFHDGLDDPRMQKDPGTGLRQGLQFYFNEGFRIEVYGSAGISGSALHERVADLL